MTPRPAAGTPTGDAQLAIQRLARASGSDVQELMTLYALEALLARLAVSEFREDFVLKGGVLLAAFALRRPTKDIDLQATHVLNEETAVAARIRQIAAISLDDGVVFDADSVRASTIRDDDQYPGIRVKVVAELGRARIVIGADVNFGDPVWPAPQLVEIPRLLPLGQPAVQLMGYPLTMVLAEKLVTAMDRGPGNTRWRDFADIVTITGAHEVDAGDLASCLTVVADHRQVRLSPISSLVPVMSALAQNKWLAWRRRMGRESELPELFVDVLLSVSAFADPVVAGLDAASWNPAFASGAKPSDWQLPVGGLSP